MTDEEQQELIEEYQNAVKRHQIKLKERQNIIEDHQAWVEWYQDEVKRYQDKIKQCQDRIKGLEEVEPMITLKSNQLGYIVDNDDSQTVYVQSDHNFPSLAHTFGWCACSCGLTDGTIDCKHRTATDMISEARQYLNAHIGDQVVDPGYF